MKPEVHLLSRLSPSFVREVVSDFVPESGNESRETAALISGQAVALLKDFLTTIVGALGASAGMVRVRTPNEKQFRMLACNGFPGKNLHSGMADELSDADFCRHKYGDGFFDASCKHVLAVPLGESQSNRTPEGVITLFFTTEQCITDEAGSMLKTYAELARIALKNFWQNEEAYQNNFLAERQSIANEIHDSFAQTLYYAKIRASLLLEALKADNDILAFKCAQDIDEALQGSQKTVRELVTHFRCQRNPKGLKPALQKLMNDFSARTSIALEYRNEMEDIELPLEHELQIFFILKEALINIATHSGATGARLTGICSDNQCRFSVEDNGVGFGGNCSKEGHYGLSIMHERALRIGGLVEIDSVEGSGTRVQLIFTVPQVA